MKTETRFRYSNYPLKVVEDKKQVAEKLVLIVVTGKEFKNQRFAFIDNKAIQDCANWDASWFANYE